MAATGAKRPIVVIRPPWSHTEGRSEGWDSRSRHPCAGGELSLRVHRPESPFRTALTIAHSRLTVAGFAPLASRACRYFSTSIGFKAFSIRSPKEREDVAAHREYGALPRIGEGHDFLAQLKDGPGATTRERGARRLSGRGPRGLAKGGSPGPTSISSGESSGSARRRRAARSQSRSPTRSEACFSRCRGAWGPLRSSPDLTARPSRPANSSGHSRSRGGWQAPGSN